MEIEKGITFYHKKLRKYLNWVEMQPCWDSDNIENSTISYSDDAWNLAVDIFELLAGGYDINDIDIVYVEDWVEKRRLDLSYRHRKDEQWTELVL